MIRKVLVTGSKGQLGESLSKIEKDFPQYEFIHTDKEELDITNRSALEAFFESQSPWAVLHLAAYTSVDKAESEERLCREINSAAPRTIAQLCQRHSAKMLFVSTDFVFDGKKSSPYLPWDEVNPLSVYGRTKAEGEKAVREYCENSLIVRTSWLYSEYGTNFVKTMRRLGAEREELGVVFDQVGSPCYASDLARVLLLCLEKDFNGEILHLSNEGVCSWYDFARKIMEISRLDCRVKPIRSADYPSAAARPHFSLLDKSETKAFLGIDIPHWEESLRECIKNMEK